MSRINNQLKRTSRLSEPQPGGKRVNSRIDIHQTRTKWDCRQRAAWTEIVFWCSALRTSHFQIIKIKEVELKVNMKYRQVQSWQRHNFQEAHKLQLPEKTWPRNPSFDLPQLAHLFRTLPAHFKFLDIRKNNSRGDQKNRISWRR